MWHLGEERSGKQNLRAIFGVHGAAPNAAGIPRGAASLGKRAETITSAENAVRFANSPSIITTTASALARVGQNAAAKQLFSKALAQSKDRYVCRFLVAATYTELGEKENAFESLEQGFLQRSTCMPWIGVDPRLNPLRSDPRFQDLVRRIGLPQS
jgi:predicted Zn-dependent protease